MNPSFTMRQHVASALSSLQTECQVRVLYACESGSRAWGFASQDSDYDVRFLYVHPRDWYLSVRERRDVIERQLSHDLDVSGWDLRKALRLLRTSNPSLLEWLQSPVVYRQSNAFVADLRALAAQCFSPRRCFAHYLHMCWGNWRKYLLGRPEVNLKKYLYVVRPVLAARWLARGLGPVPMRFADLVAAVLEEFHVREELEVLVREKVAGLETTTAPPLPVLHQFLAAELARLETYRPPEEPEAPVEALDALFRRHALAL